MKKRLRKKLYLGEFRESGFAVQARFRPGLDEASREAFLGPFLDAVSREGLSFAGGTTPQGLDGFLMLDRRGSTTEAHRERVRALLAGDKNLTEPTVGPLEDAWHGVGAR